MQITFLGRANNVEDFLPRSRSYTFPTGSVDGATQCFTITLVDDLLLEGDENFSVDLTVNTAGVIEGNTITTVIIIDDEGKFDYVYCYVTYTPHE